MERFVHDTQTALGCHTQICHSGHLRQMVFTSFSRNNKPSGWVLTRPKQWIITGTCATPAWTASQL